MSTSCKLRVDSSKVCTHKPGVGDTHWHLPSTYHWYPPLMRGKCFCSIPCMWFYCPYTFNRVCVIIPFICARIFFCGCVIVHTRRLAWSAYVRGYNTSDGHTPT